MLALMLLVLTELPPASRAAQLARERKWEELYLAYAAGPVEGLSKKDRGIIGKALGEGCTALEGEDPVMAFSLGERSLVLAPTPAATLCAALSAKRSDQRSAAEALLTDGMTRFPKEPRLPLELGRLYAEDGQADEALRALSKVPRTTKESAEAKRLAATLSAPSVAAPPNDERAAPERAMPPAPVSSRSYESAVDEEGRRLRQNQFFRFRYFNRTRDFGQRAEYEGAVQAALDDARRWSERLLGVAREKPLDVILYSREEFRLHHGPQAAGMVAGFYGGDAIRMNDSAEINDHNRAVLVHEYVHAVMDELTSFNHAALPVWMHEGTAELIEWRAQGGDGPPVGLERSLRQLALQHQLPPLKSFSQGPLIGMRDPALAYAQSAVAVRVLLQRRSMPQLLELMRECGAGAAFDDVLERRFGVTSTRLDEELEQTLAGH